MVHGIEGGVHPGDIIDIDDDVALRYIANGMAEAELDGPIGPAYQKPSPDEMARLRAKLTPALSPLAELREKVARAARPKTTAEEKLAKLKAIPGW